MMRTRASLLVLVGTAALAIGGCSAPGETSVVAPDAPVEAPTGTGDFVPDEVWFTGLVDAQAELEQYLGWWKTQACDYQLVIDKDLNCSVHLTGVQRVLTTIDALLVDVVSIAPGSEDLVAELATPAAIAAEGAATAASYVAAECDYFPNDDCTSDGDAMIALGDELDVALAGWEPPTLPE